MSTILTDSQIAELLADPKPVPYDYRPWLSTRKLRLKPEKRVRRESRSDNGRRFEVVIRESLQRRNYFSIILRYCERNYKYTLVRCNGHHRPHRNTLEAKAGIGIVNIPANTPHIHYLTERYQKAGAKKADQYAEPCLEYCDLPSACSYLVSHFGFYLVGGDYEAEFPLFREA